MVRISPLGTYGPSRQNKRSPLAAPVAISLRSTRESWSGRRDSNSRPPEPHSGALPGCATSRHALARFRLLLPFRPAARRLSFVRAAVFAGVTRDDEVARGRRAGDGSRGDPFRGSSGTGIAPDRPPRRIAAHPSGSCRRRCRRRRRSWRRRWRAFGNFGAGSNKENCSLSCRPPQLRSPDRLSSCCPHRRIEPCPARGIASCSPGVRQRGARRLPHARPADPRRSSRASRASACPGPSSVR